MDLKNSERLGQFQKSERNLDGFTKWEKLGMDSKIGKRLEWIWKLGRNRGEFKNCREIWRIQKSQRNRYGLKNGREIGTVSKVGEGFDTD